MWQARACIFLLLSFAPLFSSAAECDRDGPETCFFQRLEQFCSWTPVGHVNLKVTSIGTWYVDLMPGEVTANIKSRTACSTGGETHCLRFVYTLDVNCVIEFSVRVRNDTSDKSELLWKTSSSVNVSEASVPITTNYNFSVIFKVETLPDQNENQGSIHMFNIRYQNTSCTLNPPDASLTSTATTPSSCNISSLSTDDEVNEPQASTLSPTSGDGENKPTESSTEAGIIVGVVVGVIVLIIVITMLLVLLRRKRRHSSKANNTTELSSRHIPNTTMSTRPLDNHGSRGNPGDAQPSSESEIPEYAVVNKQRTKKQENPPQSPYEYCDHDAHNLHQNSEPERAQGQGQDRDGISSTPTNPDPMIASGSSVYQVPRGDTTTNSEDQGEEYNALDFEGQRSFSDNRIAEGTCEDGAGTVYNHLNDGDEDAYNEVDRHNKALGFSDEYSHIQ